MKKITNQNSKSFKKVVSCKLSVVSCRNGFTLIEAIVSIGILIIGLTGVLSLANQSLSIASASKTRLVASNLAQEGIEVIRNNRDNNWLAEIPFNSGLLDGDYQVDDPITGAVGAYQDKFLYFDQTTGLYNNLDVGTASAFKRRITITTASPTELKAVVQINWTDRNRNLSLSAEERLLDWK